MSCPNIIPRKKLPACEDLRAWTPPILQIKDCDLYVGRQKYATLKKKEGDYYIFEPIAKNKFTEGQQIKVIIMPEQATELK